MTNSAAARPVGTRPLHALWALAAATGLAGEATEARAQARATENVVRQAEDAFGTSLGRESIGIYSSGSVRGFSPSTAGNGRIDGLYVDQVDLDSRLRRATVIRVGFTAFGFPFSAPTGIVDYQLRRPGQTPSRSVYIGGDTYMGFSLEADAVMPVNEKLSIGLGAGLDNNEFPNGTDFIEHVVGVHALWQPRPDLDIQPFASHQNMYNNESGPNMVPAVAGTLPPFPGRRHFRGPDWANSSSNSTNLGSIFTWRPADGWTARAGLFRSAREEGVSYSNLMLGVDAAGVGRQIISIDPPSESASTSGEARLTRTFVEGPRMHQLHFSLRGRDRERVFGGGVDYDLGLISIFDEQLAPKPTPTFRPTSRDEVRQYIFGLAYEGRWRDRGELSLGIQKPDYEMKVFQPGLPVAVSKASPILWNAGVAVNLSPSVAVYAGATRGLEESGVAPGNAVNRNTALPAIETEQMDAGVRWRLRPGLNLIAGAFEIRKPYSNLDEANVWRELGEVRNRGIETSLSGQVAPGLTVLAGAVLIDAEVTGDAVRLGRVGRRPVGSTATTVLFNADWSPASLPKMSFDMGVNYGGRQVATRDNRTYIPARTTLDVGMRYRLQIAGATSVLRAQVRNIEGKKTFSMRGPGAFGVTNGRVFALSLASDF